MNDKVAGVSAFTLYRLSADLKAANLAVDSQTLSSS